MKFDKEGFLKVGNMSSNFKRPLKELTLKRGNLAFLSWKETETTKL